MDRLAEKTILYCSENPWAARADRELQHSVLTTIFAAIKLFQTFALHVFHNFALKTEIIIFQCKINAYYQKLFRKSRVKVVLNFEKAIFCG